jgi:hypothetical protein
MAGTEAITLSPEQIQAIVSSQSPALYLLGLKAAGNDALYQQVIKALPAASQAAIQQQLAGVETLPDAAKQQAYQAGAAMLNILRNPPQQEAGMPLWQQALIGGPNMPGPSGGTVPSPAPSVAVNATRDANTESNLAAAGVPAAPPAPGPAPGTAAATTAGTQTSGITQQQVEANTARNMPIQNVGKPQVIDLGGGRSEIRFSNEQLAFYTQKINENAQRAQLQNPQYNPYLNPNVDPTMIGLDRLRGPMNLEAGQLNPSTGQPKQTTLADIMGLPPKK